MTTPPLLRDKLFCFRREVFELITVRSFVDRFFVRFAYENPICLDGGCFFMLRK